MTEHDLQCKIQKALCKDGYTVFRINVMGSYTKDGRFVPPSVPKGFTDLIAVKDGRASFIEVKCKPNKPTAEQINFIERMKNKGCCAGVAYSVEEALEICQD